MHKPFGFFGPDGNPVATGDAWHDWTCPNPVYRLVEVMDEWSGEVYHETQKVLCPWDATSTKTDTCSKCGMVFRYP